MSTHKISLVLMTAFVIASVLVLLGMVMFIALTSAENDKMKALPLYQERNRTKNEEMYRAVSCNGDNSSISPLTRRHGVHECVQRGGIGEDPRDRPQTGSVEGRSGEDMVARVEGLSVAELAEMQRIRKMSFAPSEWQRNWE